MLSIQLNNTVIHHRCHSPVGTVARLQLLMVLFQIMSRNICPLKRVRPFPGPVEPPIQWNWGLQASGIQLTAEFHLKLFRLLLPLSKQSFFIFKRSCPYRAVNTLRLSYKNQPVNAVQ
jgi:hypothetical protein